MQIIGKTNLSEFSVAPSGFNKYFGTPVNPLARGWQRIPGGSSSGSAVAVATGMADIAFGTDTAGSIRVRATCCGIVGLKTTRDLVSLDGVYPIEPNLMDAVGPMAKDVAGVVAGMDLLSEGFAAWCVGRTSSGVRKCRNVDTARDINCVPPRMCQIGELLAWSDIVEIASGLRSREREVRAHIRTAAESRHDFIGKMNFRFRANGEKRGLHMPCADSLPLWKKRATGRKWQECAGKRGNSGANWMAANTLTRFRKSKN